MRSRADAAPALIFAADLSSDGTTLRLSPAESHYVARVCRARSGDVVSATDGRGAIASLRVIQLKPVVEARVESVERHERRREAWVWCGAPEGQRADWLVEKLAELGVSVLQPLQCEQATWPIGREDRWQRLAVAALRQSRRPYLMEVRQPVSLAAALTRIPESAARWLGTPNGPPGLNPGAESGLSIGAIGPSPGFTADETRALELAGFRSMRLSDGRLRCETAALAWAALWTR